MRVLELMAILCASACTAEIAGPTAPDPAGAPEGCRTHDECPARSWCLSGQCAARPAASPSQPEDIATLTAAPGVLGFGSLAAGTTRRLGIVLTNAGETMLTLGAVRVEPATAPFRVEPLGYGPFWIRPGRSRDLFVTFVPTSATRATAELVIESEAESISVGLGGN